MSKLSLPAAACPRDGTATRLLKLAPALFTLGVLLSTFSPTAALGVMTQETVHGDAETLAQGELEQVSLSGDGTLSLGPVVTALASLTDPILWKLARTSGGTLYLATGNDGRVYRLPPGATQPVIAADFAETQVMALAVSPAGEVYAASSPDGKVYKIPPSGEPTLVVDPDAKYVWDLAFDPQGRLLVAGGSPGGVWRVTDKKGLEPILKTAEAHVLSLATDGRGTLYAGSAEHGYLYKVNLNRLAETPQVLLDAPGTEVRQVLILPDGAVAALTLGLTDDDEDKNPLSGLHTKATGETKEEDALETQVFRLREQQAPEVLWHSIGLSGQSLGLLGETLVMGMAEAGKLVALHGPDKATWLSDVGGEQLTALLPDTGGALLVAASNPASVHRVEARTAEQGIYRSPVIDAGRWATWGIVDVRSERPETGTVSLQTRSGNTDKPDATWSPWADVNTAGTNSGSTAGSTAVSAEVSSGPSRYLQYRLTLKPKDGKPPRVRAVGVFWQGVNQAPKVTSFTVLDPGIRVEKKEDFKSEPEPRGINRPKNPPSSPSLKEREEEGAQGFRWESEDPDQDTLSYSVALREVGAAGWRGLASELQEPFFNVDARTLPDGWYELRLVASDKPSNRSETARTAEKVSPRFPVDHTPPLLAGASVKAAGRDALIRLDAQDTTTRLARAALSLSGGAWIPLFPEDGVLDEPEERMSLTLPNLAPGTYTVVIEVQDWVGNRATGKYPLTIK